MKKISIFPLIFILLILSGCFRPYPIYDLNPSGDYTTRWLFGSEYVIMENGNVIASLAYVNSERDFLVFDLEVINKSETDILVAPEIFYYHPLISETHADTMKIPALDPRLQLMKIDKLLSQKRAHQANQNLSNIIAETTDLIGDIADSDDMSVEEKQLEKQEDLARHIEQHKEETQTRNQITDLNQQRQYWASEVLRKTTLKQNEAIEGRIYFPTEREIEKIMVVLTLGEFKFEVVFDQARF